MKFPFFIQVGIVIKLISFYFCLLCDIKQLHERHRHEHLFFLENCIKMVLKHCETMTFSEQRRKKEERQQKSDMRKVSRLKGGEM